MKNKQANYDITSTNSTIDKYVKLNKRDKEIKHKIRNGIVSGAMIVSLLLPTNKCKSPESPNGNGNGSTSYALTITNKNIMNDNNAGGRVQINGVWVESGGSVEIDAPNGTATINSIHVDPAGYNHSYIIGDDGSLFIIKDREGPKPFTINRNTTIEAKLIPDNIDTVNLAKLVGKNVGSGAYSVGDGEVWRFDNSMPARDVGIRKSNTNGLEPTPTMIKYLKECINQVNECNGQQARYIGKITQDYVDKGVTHFVKDSTPYHEFGTNDDGSITRSGLITHPEHPKYAVLEEYLQAVTGLVNDGGYMNFPYINPGPSPYNNPEIIPKGKTFIKLVKRLPLKFRLSTSEKNPAAYTEQTMSTTTRPWGAPKDYHEFANPTNMPGQRNYDNAHRDKRVKKDYQRIKK